VPSGGVRRNRFTGQHFGRLVDYGFTAAMEDELDAIASGQEHAPTGSTTSIRGDHGGDSVHEPVASRNCRRQPRRIDAREVNSSSCLRILKVDRLCSVGRTALPRTHVTGDDGEPTHSGQLSDSLTQTS